MKSCVLLHRTNPFIVIVFMKEELPLLINQHNRLMEPIFSGPQSLSGFFFTATRQGGAHMYNDNGGPEGDSET